MSLEFSFFLYSILCVFKFSAVFKDQNIVVGPNSILVILY
jgi:hypothetical protein